MVLQAHTDEEVMGFVAHPALAEITQRGTVTPDHVIRTKPWPLLGRDVDAYGRRYGEYFERHRGDQDLERLDPAPRVILDPQLGMSCAGGTPREARVAADIYRHTMKVILDAEVLGGYQPATIADLFAVEYWELEQAKLRRGAKPAPFAGEVAFVTGAAGGIGKACAAALMAEGAAVVGVDLDAEIEVGFDGPNWLGVQADVTDGDAMQAALDAAVERFGGLDVLVVNAGVFPPSCRIADLQLEEWRRIMAVNVDAGAALLSAAHPLLALAPAPNRGRVVVIGSRNVPAPGAGAGAYSASKAALTQLARVAALEWGADGIRVNVIHPNAVFDTAIWSEAMLADRAAQYGMTVDEYRTNNVLGAEITERGRRPTLRRHVRPGVLANDRRPGSRRLRQRPGDLGALAPPAGGHPPVAGGPRVEHVVGRAAGPVDVAVGERGGRPLVHAEPGEGVQGGGEAGAGGGRQPRMAQAVGGGLAPAVDDRPAGALGRVERLGVVEEGGRDRQRHLPPRAREGRRSSAARASPWGAPAGTGS